MDRRSDDRRDDGPGQRCRCSAAGGAAADRMDRVIQDHRQQLAQQLLRDADQFDSSIHARPSLSPEQWRLIARWLLEEPCPT